MEAQLVHEWNLSSLYKDPQDPDLQTAVEKIVDEAKAFRQKYEGNVVEIAATAPGLSEFLDDYQGILKKATRIGYFAGLHHAMDTSIADRQRLKDLVQRQSSMAQQQLVFVTLELQELSPEKIHDLCQNESLSAYRYFLLRLIEQKRHTLSKDLEELIIDKNQTGRRAFVDLISNHFARLKYTPVLADGKSYQTFPELSALREHSDRSIRQTAYEAMITPLKEHNFLYGFALNQIVQDAARENSRRNFPSTLDAKLFDHEIDRETFDALMDVCEQSRDAVSRFMKLKADRLKVDQLESWDLLAPITEKPDAIDYRQATDMVLDSAKQFSPTFHRSIKETIDSGHIDSKIRPAKRSGAFCASPYVTKPYVLLSYSNDYRSLFTLAHELGHAVHGDLACGQQPYLVFHAPLVTCELASIFNEFLMTDFILANSPSAKVRDYLLMTQAQDVISTFYRQARISYFEKMVHERSQKEPLDVDTINEMWLSEYVSIYGDRFHSSDLTRYDWSYIHHMYFEPFYCYNYALSYAVSLACYHRFQSEGESFVETFLTALRSGGSVSPKETLAPLGIDLHSRETYESVVKHLNSVLDQIEAGP